MNIWIYGIVFVLFLVTAWNMRSRISIVEDTIAPLKFPPKYGRNDEIDFGDKAGSYTIVGNPVWESKQWYYFLYNPRDNDLLYMPESGITDVDLKSAAGFRIRRGR